MSEKIANIYNAVMDSHYKFCNVSSRLFFVSADILGCEDFQLGELYSIGYTDRASLSRHIESRNLARSENILHATAEDLRFLNRSLVLRGIFVKYDSVSIFPFLDGIGL